jgi:hypothetical protein
VLSPDAAVLTCGRGAPASLELLELLELELLAASAPLLCCVQCPPLTTMTPSLQSCSPGGAVFCADPLLPLLPLVPPPEAPLELELELELLALDAPSFS